MISNLAETILLGNLSGLLYFYPVYSGGGLPIIRIRKCYKNKQISKHATINTIKFAS